MMEQKLHVPDRETFLVSDETRFLLKYVDGVTEKHKNINVLIRGLSGCGKSELVAQFAATRNRPLAVLEVGRLSESSQIFGSKSIENGSIVYKPGLFTEAIQTENAVIHLQEINRSETDKALNAIFSVLDETFRRIWLDELGRTVKVAPGVTFFATMNEGYQFIGTMPLDEALANRFAISIALGYLPASNEQTLILTKTGLPLDQTINLIELVNGLRTNTQEPIHISTRNTLAMADLMLNGASLFLALKATIGTMDRSKLEQVLVVHHLSEDQGFTASGMAQAIAGVDDTNYGSL